MKILEDIKNILINNKNTEHHLEIRVAWDGITIYLQYDPELNFADDCIIPIKYSVVDKVSYIPQEEFCNSFHPDELGLEYQEINLIKEIMDYLEGHSTEIQKLCHGYDWESREINKEGK